MDRPPFDTLSYLTELTARPYSQAIRDVAGILSGRPVHVALTEVYRVGGLFTKEADHGG